MGTVSETSRGAEVNTSVPQPTAHEGPGLRRILVCLDRSTFAEGSLPYAVSLAKAFGSTLTLLHVMPPPPCNHTGPHATDALGWEISRQEAGSYLERLERQATQAVGRPVGVRLEQGHPAERIVALARELGADLTVLGSHGEGGVTAWNLGSTVQQILSMARGSVLISRSSAPPVAAVTLNRILVPLDGSLRTESVLPTAARMAKAYNAELLLAHVVQEPLATSVLRPREELDLAQDLATRLETSAKRYLERLGDQLAHEVSSVRTRVLRSANESLCLLDLSREEQVDLIVLSAHGSACNPTRPFGTVATHLLTHSMVPLLVLQDLAEYELHHPMEAALEHAPLVRSSFAPGNA